MNYKQKVSILNKTDIKNLSRDQLREWLQERDIAPYRANQIFKWIYLRQTDRFEEMTDISKGIRELLDKHFTIERLQIIHTEVSRDKSRKYLFRLNDGHHIESVLMPEKSRSTLCISTQVGCAQNCSFCLTAKGGFIRNLTAAEIISQIRDVQQAMADSKLTNIVLMGMGEPLANCREVIKALNIITDGDYGLKFSSRRVTLSTAGLVPRFAELGQAVHVNLAVSLNATDNETRSLLMPINRKYPLEMLLDACRRYPLAPRQKITFEYILIKGVNDSPEDALRLTKLLRPIQSKVNLIPFNEHAGSPFKRPSESVIQNFLKILLDHHITAIIRKSKGQDISAACGQLSANAKRQAQATTNIV